MPSVRLIHWHAGEAEERAARLRAAGWEVDASQFNGPAGLRALRETPPLAVVIDLSRLPMQGRDVGLAVRQLRGIHRMAGLAGREGMWIAWPKKTSALASDLTQADVRHVGLTNGLVDCMVCAVDADWAGLKFARRK